MHFENEFKVLYSEIEKLLKRDQQHNINDETNFLTLKNEILDTLRTIFGETSREYRVVKLTNSPKTVLKVMNHIAARTKPLTSIKTAVNM